MNDVIKTILNRRSVRVYSSELISAEHLESILKCGLYAPSGCNEQPWHFTVIQNKDLIKELSVEAKKEFANSENEDFRMMANNEKFDMFYNAPAIVVVSGRVSAITAPIDCAAATENMILAAESLGIGSCWVGLVTFLFKSARAKEYLEKLQIPEGYEPYYAITLGYKKYPNPKAQPRCCNTVNYIN